MIARIATRSFGAWTSPLRGSRTILTKVVVCIPILQFATMTLTREISTRIRDVAISEGTHFMPRPLVALGEEKNEDLYARAAKSASARDRDYDLSLESAAISRNRGALADESVAPRRRSAAP